MLLWLLLSVLLSVFVFVFVFEAVLAPPFEMTMREGEKESVVVVVGAAQGLLVPSVELGSIAGVVQYPIY